ncbi:hypothetical protein Cpir12675_007001, partial [Ceratocystis pirilliformis]
ANTDIKRIVALTHIGIDHDIELAKATRGLSLIMGGHTHTLLGDMPGAEDKYPVIAEDADGNEVFVVTAHRWGTYVGEIEVAFDEDGHALSYEGAPIPITDKTPFDAELQADIDEWRLGFDYYASKVVGSAVIDLDQTMCQLQECLLGNVVADAMIDYVMRNPKSKISKAEKKRYFALVNSGGMRATIETGKVTLGEVLTVLPFKNNVVDVEFDGSTLWEIFEGAVAKQNIVNGLPITSFFQVSQGVEIVYNPAMPTGSRLISVKINGKQIMFGETYHMVTIDFMLEGGDNMLLLDNANQKATYEELDVVLLDYLDHRSPIKAQIDGRIVKSDVSSSSEHEAVSSSDSDSDSDSDNEAVSYADVHVASTGALPVHAAVSTGSYPNTTTGYSNPTATLVPLGSAGSTAVSSAPRPTYLETEVFGLNYCNDKDDEDDYHSCSSDMEGDYGWESDDESIEEDPIYHATIATSSLATSTLVTAPAATGSGVPIDYQATSSGYNQTTSIGALSTGISVVLTTGPTKSISMTVRPTHSEAEINGLDYYMDWSDSDLETDYDTDSSDKDEDYEAGVSTGAGNKKTADKKPTGKTGGESSDSESESDYDSDDEGEDQKHGKHPKAKSTKVPMVTGTIPSFNINPTAA